MLVSFNWLKEYVNIEPDVKTFGDIMTMSGTKVETIQPVSDQVSGIFTGKIIKINPHPNADKLVICDVDFGKEKGVIPIITSAKNVFEGAVVPVALEGAVINDGTKMKETEFRGVVSKGMMCSAAELGMDTSLFSKEALNGIYILPSDTECGLDVRKLLWIDDQIIDIELTANRSDCQSMYGIAREAAAALDEKIAPVKLYDSSLEKGMSGIEKYLSVNVESDLCSRYTAKMFKVKKIEPSPLWMQVKLLNCGVRPINNIVDVTNYVMLELGQPLHAFDYKSLNSDKIVVKQSDAKTVTTLDGNEREIDNEMLMITNGSYPVAVAGVMGGLNSEITEDTEYVVLESACFDKTSIRRTSRKLGLRTEASARYEKGMYPALADVASLRATYLFEQIGACEVIPGFIDIYKKPTEPKTITVDCDWVNRFIGIDLSAEEMVNILQRLFLKVELQDNKMIVFVPEYRQDLEIPEDIAEEIARIYGYDRIPNTIMGGATLVGVKTDAQQYQDKIENALVGAGFYQTMTTSFTGPTDIAKMQLEKKEEPVKIINPLGEDSSIMRNTLAGNQLLTIALNHSRKNPEGAFFEIAQTYHQNPKPDELPIHIPHLVISQYGGKCDFYELKGILEMIAEISGIRFEFKAGGDSIFHPGRCAVVSVDGEDVGQIGEIHPKVVKNFGLPKRVYLAELNFKQMLAHKKTEIHYKELPKFPASSRDLAIIVDKDIPSSEVYNIIEKNGGALVESISLFDVYYGAPIPKGKKSLAYSIVFRSAERTLKDKDINPIVDSIVNELTSSLDAKLRDE